MSKDKKLFAGFQKPNYTMVPDELFDELMPDLSGGELKVLLYIVRRTFGFKKDSDNISLSQMMKGIKTRDGRVLDRGVGLTKKTVLSALRGLEEKNIIITQRRQSSAKGNEPTCYRLNIIGIPVSGNSPEENTPPLGEKVPQGGGGKSTPRARGKNYATQETVEQETERQYSNIRMENQEQKSEFTSTSEILANRSPQVNSAASPQILADDRQIILAFIEDFAREFNDRAALRSSVSRAVNIYRRSGTNRETFFSALYQARSTTREYTATIRSREEGGTKHQPKRKMAYFFAVLEDLLRLRDDTGASDPPEQDR